MVKELYRAILHGVEARQVYDVLNKIEETAELPAIDLTKADEEVLNAFTVSITLLNIDDVETALLCPPNPPTNIEVLSVWHFNNADQLIKYITEKQSQRKLVAVFDRCERDYVILK